MTGDSSTRGRGVF